MMAASVSAVVKHFPLIWLILNVVAASRTTNGMSEMSCLTMCKGLVDQTVSKMQCLAVKQRLRSCVLSSTAVTVLSMFSLCVCGGLYQRVVVSLFTKDGLVLEVNMTMSVEVITKYIKSYELKMHVVRFFD